MLWKFLLEYVFRTLLGVSSCKTEFLPFHQTTIFPLGITPEFKGSYTGGMSWWLHRKEFGTDISPFLFKIILCTSSSKTVFKITSWQKNSEFHCNFPWRAVCYHKKSYFMMTLFYIHFIYFSYKNLEKLIAQPSSI